MKTILNYFGFKNHSYPDQIAQLRSRDACAKFIDQSITDARFEKLLSVGYGSLSVITTLALFALAFVASFVGFGLVTAGLYQGADGLVSAVTFVVHGAFFAGIAGPLLAYHPVKLTAGYFFNLATEHWNQADTLYIHAHLADLRKTEL